MTNELYKRFCIKISDACYAQAHEMSQMGQSTREASVVIYNIGKVFDRAAKMDIDNTGKD